MTKRHGNAKEMDWDTLNALLQSRPTLQLCADYLECSDTHIENEIKRVHKMTFSEYRESRMAFVKVKLIQQAIQMAIKGNVTMLIFCLKNLCGWADKIENKIEEKPTKELIEQAKELIASYEKDKDETAPH